MTTDGDGPRSTKPLTVAIVLAVTMFAFDALAVPTVMPAVAADLGGISLYGAAFSGFMLASIVSMVVGGHVADLRGPATTLTGGVVLFFVGLVIGAAAPTMPAFVAARAVQGLGAGTVGSTVYAAVGRGYPPEARSRMFAITSAAWVLPGLVGPALAASIADWLGWRWVLAGLVPVPVLVGVLAVPSLRRLAPERAARMEPGVTSAALRLALGAGVVLLLTSAEVDLPLVARLAGSAAGGWTAWTALGRLVPAGTWRAAPGVPAAVASRALLAGGFFAVDAFLPLAITGIHGRSTLFAGLVLTAGSLTWSVGAFVQSRRVERWGLAGMARSGAAVLAVGIVASAVVLVDAASPILAIGAWMVAGAGMGLAFNSITVHGMDHTPAGEEGRSGSALQVGDALAISATTGLGGGVVALGEGRGWDLALTLGVVWVAMVAVSVAAVLVTGNLRRGEPASGAVAFVPTEGGSS